jgi:hypothetical protein
MIGLVGGCKD